MIVNFEDIERQRCEHCPDCAGCCRDIPLPDTFSRLRAVLLMLAFSSCVLLLAGLVAGSPAFAADGNAIGSPALTL